ncbi:MAG: mercury methylation ferredoxin HgcB [Thermodesulfobacteriota bacterium]
MGKLIYLKNVVTLSLDPEKCIGCGMCLIVCPQAVFSLCNGNAVIVNRDGCIECGACAKNCRAEALSVETGVGCAAAVINTALGRKNESCCCIIEPQRNPNPCSDPRPSQSRSGCC